MGYKVSYNNMIQGHCCNVVVRGYCCKNLMKIVTDGETHGRACASLTLKSKEQIERGKEKAGEETISCFLVLAPCKSGLYSRHFRETYCRNHKGWLQTETLMLEVICASKTSETEPISKRYQHSKAGWMSKMNQRKSLKPVTDSGDRKTYLLRTLSEA
jgi:hypothetical protein